jgi:hypothetical protein
VEKKAINPGLEDPFVPVVATGTNKAGLKAEPLVPVIYEPGPIGLHVARVITGGKKAFNPGL